MSTHLVLIHALSPVHCGTGQGVGGIDLPIARERPTGIPLIPGSSLKGVLGARGERTDDDHIHVAAFGPDTNEASEHAGALQFGDAMLLLLPVRSVRGTFAWVSSPYLLRRFLRDALYCGVALTALNQEPRDDEAFVTGDRLVVTGTGGAPEKVVFDDFDFTARKSDEVRIFAEKLAAILLPNQQPAQKHLTERLCFVSDDVMRVLLRTSMEITARNRINNETKTVERGALWTEEALPVESILYAVLAVTPVGRGKRKNGEARRSYTDVELVQYLRGLMSGGVVQIGGKATVGRGLCRVEVL